jgi:oligoendopeptidase F
MSPRGQPAAPAREDIEALPEWNLGDLYASPEAPEVEADLEWARAGAQQLEAEAKGKLADMEGDALADLIVRYEAIEERLGRIMSYAQLLHATRMDDPQIGRFFRTGLPATDPGCAMSAAFARISSTTRSSASSTRSR